MPIGGLSTKSDTAFFSTHMGFDGLEDFDELEAILYTSTQSILSPFRSFRRILNSLTPELPRRNRGGSKRRNDFFDPFQISIARILFGHGGHGFDDSEN